MFVVLAPPAMTPLRFSVITLVLTASRASLALQPSVPAEAAPAGSPPGAPSPARPEEPPAPPTAAPPASDLMNVVSKFKVQIYGFVELDMIHDTTQSFNELAGDALIARPGTYAANHSRMMFSVRNSRLGFKVGGPSSDVIKSSAVAEMDFLGNQPSNPPATSEAAFFTNPTFRVRHAYFKLETPVVDVLAGQTWGLFGWQPYFDPASVQIQGLPGEVFTRAPQLRISHTFKTDPVNVEVAVAASRPPQRDGDAPDGQGGLRLSFNDWKGYRTVGSAGTALDSAAIGVSGAVRNFTVTEYAATPQSSEHATGWGLSIDALLPIVPATKESHDNALTLNGSFATGSGNSDLYTGLNGGVGFPRLENADGTTAPYTANIDNGLVTYDADGDLHTIGWTSYLFGAQYFLPFGGLWLAGNFSHMHSPNTADFGAAPASVMTDSTFIDGNLFWDALEGVRFGAEYAHFEQKYADNVKAKNERLQVSAFYIF
jgi:hypothetical protein